MVEINRPMNARHPQKVRVPDGPHKGRWAYRDMTTEHGSFRITAGNWPHVSWAMGINPSQMQECQKFCARNGVPTEYVLESRKGGKACVARPIMRSRSHRKDFHRLMQVYDRDAGHGDQGPERAGADLCGAGWEP